MAEFVQQSLCQIKLELENISNLTLKEKRNILKKRERFEYRIRKRTKQENDYLRYIQYEKDVLKFVRKRSRMGKTKEKAHIPIVRRIHQLYQLCETRFPQSVDTWMQHAEFCKQEKEFGRVERIFMEMLRTHTNEPELWVQAAKWQVEQSNIDAARALMQRCVNYNKTSILAWSEFYRMELQISKSMRGKKDNIDESDPTQSGAIAELVSKHACQEMPDNLDLLLSLISVTEKFKFAKSQRDGMMTVLTEQFSDVPKVWDYLARRRLPLNRKKMFQLSEVKEENFFHVYQQAVTKIPSKDMWTLYLEACLHMVTAPSVSPDRLQKRVERTLDVFQTASDDKCLTQDMYVSWVCLLTDVLQADRAMKVSEEMVACYPASARAWSQRLQLLCQTLASPEDLVFCLDTALRTVPEQESWCLWETVLQYLTAADHPDTESLMEKACQRLYREVCMPAKLLYLRWTALTKTMKATRTLYKRMSVLKPVPLDFFLEYAKLELMQDVVKMKKVRRAFEDAVSDYGTKEPDLWLQYVKMEMTSPRGDPAQASFLHSRALVNLPDGQLRDSFVLRYAEAIGVPTAQ